MSRLGRVNYRDKNQSAFLMASGGDERIRSHSEETSREIDQEVCRIINDAIEKVRHILEVRKEALFAITEKLIEVESIAADELRQIVEENSTGPLVVPGTDMVPNRPKSEQADVPRTESETG